MAIPRAPEPVLLPSPPLSYIPEFSPVHDLDWQRANDPKSFDFGRAASVKPGSSLLGGTFHRFRKEQERDTYTLRAAADARRGSSVSTVTVDRDYKMVDDQKAHSPENGSVSRPSFKSSHRLQSERQLELRTLEASSNTYDKQLLSRIGGPNTARHLLVSHTTSLPGAEQLSPSDGERRNSQLRPLSVPERRHTASNSLISPAGSGCRPPGGSPPGFSGWGESSIHDWSPHTRHGSIVIDDSLSHRGSYDDSTNKALMDDGEIGNLNIHDRSPSGLDDLSQLKAGTKRRASSPSREATRDQHGSVCSGSGQSEVFRGPAHSGQFLLRSHPYRSSISLASSLGPHHGLLGSSLGIAGIPCSATSYASQRLSLRAAFPALDSALRLGTSFESTRVLRATHQGTLSENTQVGRKPSIDSMSHSQHGSLSHLQGSFVCGLCRKKPRKFDTQDDLRLHEAEKQCTCAYCPKLFKNKTEAKRHQNSLHLRKHSWSCAALSGPEAAFHQTSVHGANVCEYCGDEFSNPPQWDIRVEHLNHVHKFGQCNQAKKFFRADHFRQHLKHSHAGTSGKWTNLLKAAYMKDELPPERRVNSTNMGAL
ncbi:hypothetical protein LTR56_015471 [Elasticomyces elasticus]|nr:hypothetical protein LTR22_022147 [Elasticomyces elasticus]KAK3634125.1 hypothetical protein LTR56_015471 [Elasticomyces elasticus]KAK4906106.1 hypothetical protein LTR49_024690 [Elasticomyces elasticus]KAK5754899.1 hypothetical protein LTS12_015022 [Elasticomyces elasticus]